MKVREQAATTLVEMYRHVGERFRVDISKKDISAAKYDVVVAVIQSQSSFVHCRHCCMLTLSLRLNHAVSVEVTRVSVS